MKVVKILFLLLVLLSKWQPVIMAQSMDPTLAAMILLYSEKAKKTLRSEEEAMLLESSGHIWLREEMNGTYKLQKEFNEYLDSFRSIMVYAAQVYGFYHEIEHMTKELTGFISVLEKSPGNALSVALSAKRNKIYKDIIFQSLEIVNDIRQICLTEIKMTEKERLEILFSVRPKLKAMNQKIARLTRMVKYSSMIDLWYEISDGERDVADKRNISHDAFSRWRELGKKVR